VFRVYDFGPFIPDAPGYGNNDLAAHGIEQVGGHHGNEIGRYRQLIGGEAGENALRPDVAEDGSAGAPHFRLLDITNAAYAVAPGRLDPGQLPGFEEVFAGSRSVVYHRPGVLPRAYLAGRFEVISDDRAVDRLLAADFDARTTVLLPEPLPAGVVVEPDPQGAAEWVERGINEFTLRVTSDRAALLVMSDNYYPAWQVTVSGEPAPLLRANYTFRAVPVPAGTHEVTFTYRSPLLEASIAVSVALLVLLIGTAVVGTLRARRHAGSAGVAAEGA
jgi:hypothetical protein